MMNKYFKREDLDKIENTITEVEKKTSGEIVVSISDSSGSYWWVSVMFAGLGLVLSSIYLITLQSRFPFFTDLRWYLFIPYVFMLSFSFFGRLRKIVRLVVSQNTFKKNVHAKAMQEFMQAGLTNTRDRSGVLIYISLIERRVEILADRGIYEKLGPEVWGQEVDLIINGMKSKTATQSIINSIMNIGNKLSQYFPVKSDDQNELQNKVRID